MRRYSFLFGALAVFLVLVWQSSGQATDYITYENGLYVRYIDNCTAGDSSTCTEGHCCTKATLIYSDGAAGTRPSFEIECKPLRLNGEFCYFQTPENFCPCLHHCHTNGYYGHCT